MLFTKKIFNEVGGYAENLHIPSGDDEFLIKKIQAIGKIVFLKSSTAIVRTKAMDSFADFTAQRLRWASKWDMHKSFFHSFLALVVFFLQFYWIFLILGFYSVGGNSLYFFLSFIVLKIAPEFVLLQIIMRFFNLQKNTMLIPIVQLIYPFYVLFIGLRSLSGKYEWKGRVFKKN
jgi:cellulose synthase/poly-beta-1,6-N-acetylglucosamine synthase-like glycosyltransferase